jgi:hypothetical protein
VEKLPAKYIRANDVAATHHDRTSAMMKVDMGTRRMGPEFCYPVFVCSYIVRLLFCLCKVELINLVIYAKYGRDLVESVRSRF